MSDTVMGNRLLVIDDEQAIGRVIQKTASGCGFDVVVTDDPQTFLKTARLWHPTVIMTDLKMPRVDGIQLLRELAADQCDAHVVISSGSDARVLEAAMRLGHQRGLKMSGILQKPLRIEALRTMLAGFTRVPKDVLRADLAAAIGTEQLFLQYQPKFDLKQQRFTAVEALSRWRHPRLGVIPPDEFIVLAEETDLIHGFTDWVVRTAAAQAAEWRSQNLEVEVAVNVSAKNIEDLGLPERLSDICLASGFDPDGIVLEITETGAMREAVQMMDVLTRLCLKGFRLSIDDFGTGYSSLVQLQRMPFSEIKVDKSFTMQMLRDESCRSIIEIIVDLARKLRLHSVAEGVEDQTTLQALIDFGCDSAQGYHLSRPIAASEIPKVFARNNEPAARPVEPRLRVDVGEGQPEALAAGELLTTVPGGSFSAS